MTARAYIQPAVISTAPRAITCAGDNGDPPEHATRCPRTIAREHAHVALLKDGSIFAGSLRVSKPCADRYWRRVRGPRDTQPKELDP